MDTSKKYIGNITRYEREKHFGFIETEEKETYFFFFDKAMQLKFLKDGGDANHKFSSGDEVVFRLRTSSQDRTKMEAYDLTFIRNIRRELLLQAVAENPVQKGYLKRISSGKLFVKHISSDIYIYLPLQISDWEIDQETVYEKRIDQIIEFRLTQTKNIYKLVAVLNDAKFCDEYIQLQDMQTNIKPLKASLLGKNIDGYFATLLQGKVEAFILIPKELTEAQKLLLGNLKKGDELPVKIKQIYTNKKVSLVLAV